MLPGCVVDARLVLSRHGSLAVSRLGRHFTVWVPRELWGILRHAREYGTRSALLAPRVYCASLRRLPTLEQHAAEIAAALDHWAQLPSDGGLARHLHFLGDRADESLVPSSADAFIRDRCEQLQRGLDVMMRTAGYDLPRGEIVSSCVRDAMALCAALAADGGFVLTRLEADGEGPPALCNYLDAWSIRTAEVADADARIRTLLDALDRAGVRSLSWTGVKLAAVHAFLPNLPPLGRLPADTSDERVMALWAGAQVFWHQV